MDFMETLQAYRLKWQALDAAGIVACCAPGYQGSYAHSLETVDTSTRASALAGWEAAFAQLRPLGCRWEFEDLAIRPLGGSGMLVIGWLRLHLGGRLAGETYRMEVWREADGSWQLLRDHQEYNVGPATRRGIG
ncbi:MAG: hypothetical protein K0R39_3671 [Symbiobacteriaceae bacterium]|nr:hypothetical protein [Symbiobacteriaceae bacterium]